MQISPVGNEDVGVSKLRSIAALLHAGIARVVYRAAMFVLCRSMTGSCLSPYAKTCQRCDGKLLLVSPEKNHKQPKQG